MGVYSNGSIYGVSFVRNYEVLFERTWLEAATPSQIQEVKAFYNGLTAGADIRFYTSCSTTYDIGETAPFMTWWPGDRATLEKWLAVS